MKETNIHIFFKLVTIKRHASINFKQFNSAERLKSQFGQASAELEHILLGLRA